MQPIKNIFQLACVAFFLFADIHCKTETKDAGVLSGYVVAIADGDTFTLLTEQKQQVKIRLFGIDCPEKKQPFGNVAKQKLSALIFNKNVVAKQIDIDRYKRTVAIVYDNENKCVNEEMLKSGLAWHYVKYDNNANWQQLENNARQNKIGLWADNNPVAPWQWRANMRHH